jgi:hypothetical protein
MADKGGAALTLKLKHGIEQHQQKQSLLRSS